MTIGHHASSFAGLPVVEFDPERVTRLDGDRAWRLRVRPQDGGFEALVARFLGTPGVADVRTLVWGCWGGGDGPPLVDLVGATGRLPRLTALFLGDVTVDEQEISWIVQGDVTPVLRAYPGLRVLRVRGAQDLRLDPLRHAELRELTIESGGLPAGIVQAVGGCDLPALEHLELWLGTDEYGGDAGVEDLAPVLAGTRLPRIGYLGLRDAEIADQVAEAVAGAPVVARLHTLDLSLGVLTDHGAEALLAGQPLTHLRRLDLHHHYLSAELAARVVAELSTVEVDVSDAQQPDEDGDRYIAVSE